MAGNKINHPRQTHCRRGHEFSPENTYSWVTSTGRLDRTCRICRKAAADRNNANRKPEAIEKTRARKMGLLYKNFSEEKYQTMHQEQDGLCKICGRPETGGRRLSVDHDHNTQNTRSLLCRLCNTALGSFDDDIELLAKAIAYLEFWREDQV